MVPNASTDIAKRRSLVELLFAAGYANRRYTSAFRNIQFPVWVATTNSPFQNLAACFVFFPPAVFGELRELRLGANSGQIGILP